jgi:hypothetical protein
MRVLRNLPKESPEPTLQVATPHATTNLDLSLLLSSPPEAVELSKSNKRFSESLRECSDVVSPVRRYAERMVRILSRRKDPDTSPHQICYGSSVHSHWRRFEGVVE